MSKDLFGNPLPDVDVDKDYFVEIRNSEIKRLQLASIGLGCAIGGITVALLLWLIH